MEAMNLADFLCRAVLQSVIGMPMGDVRGFFLDVVFSSSEAVVHLTGAAFDLPDRTEAFLLTAGYSDSEQRWTDPEGKAGWETEDLLASWKEYGQAGIWKGQDPFGISLIRRIETEASRCKAPSIRQPQSSSDQPLAVRPRV